MPFPVMAAIGGAQAGANILSGIFGKNAAKKAAEAQARAAQEVADQTGRTASEYGGYIANAAEGAAGGVERGVVDANDILRSIYGTAGEVTQPYRLAGGQAVTSLAELMAPGGAWSRTPTMADLELDPGFAFRMAEGTKALEASAAARGSSLGGAALKSLARYSQGVASDEYQKAFERFNVDRTTRFNMFAGLAGMGQNAMNQYLAAGQNYGNQASGNVMDAARTAGGFRFGGAQSVGDLMMRAQGIKADAITGRGNAQASGIVGGNNALWGGITGAANNAMDLYTLSRYGPQQRTPSTVQPWAGTPAPTIPQIPIPAFTPQTPVAPPPVVPYWMPANVRGTIR